MCVFVSHSVKTTSSPWCRERCLITAVCVWVWERDCVMSPFDSVYFTRDKIKSWATSRSMHADWQSFLIWLNFGSHALTVEMIHRPILIERCISVWNRRLITVIILKWQPPFTIRMCKCLLDLFRINLFGVNVLSILIGVYLFDSTTNGNRV